MGEAAAGDAMTSIWEFEGKTFAERSYWDLMRAERWLRSTLISKEGYSLVWEQCGAAGMTPRELIGQVRAEIASRSVAPPLETLVAP